VKKNIVTIAIGIVGVLLVAVAVIVIANEDKTPPVITLNIPTGREITYDSAQGRQTLIQYAKAVDGKDGDVSDSIVIEEIYLSSDLSAAKVIYVARDKSHNVAKISHDFKYVASQEEIDSLTLAQEKATSDLATLTQLANASAAAVASKAAENTTASPNKPVITLLQNELIIVVGGTFNGTSYVKDITDDKDDKDSLFRRIIITGNYDTKTAGDYILDYYCTDTDGNTSNIEKFILHVGAKQSVIVTEATTEAPVDDAPANPPADDTVDAAASKAAAEVASRTAASKAAAEAASKAASEAASRTAASKAAAEEVSRAAASRAAQ